MIEQEQDVHRDTAGEVPGGRVVRLGTRASALALWQANSVRGRLEAAGHAVRIVTITTEGDRVQDVPLRQVSGKAFFTREIDVALLDGRIDLAVHSLKDLPTTLPEGLVLAAVPPRANPRDAFVAHPSFSGRLDALPAGARVATSSVRRAALLKAWRPDLDVVPVRGNVDTRIRRLDESDWQGMVLAVAGLERLGLGHRIHTEMDPSWMTPAVGQGALGVVCVSADAWMRAVALAALGDPDASIATQSERAFLRRLEGGCQVPAGAWARPDADGAFLLDACVAAPDGARILRRQTPIDPRDPERAAVALADQLLAEGAGDLLRQARG